MLILLCKLVSMMVAHVLLCLNGPSGDRPWGIPGGLYDYRLGPKGEDTPEKDRPENQQGSFSCHALPEIGPQETFLGISWEDSLIIILAPNGKDAPKRDHPKSYCGNLSCFAIYTDITFPVRARTKLKRLASKMRAGSETSKRKGTHAQALGLARKYWHASGESYDYRLGPKVQDNPE